MGGEQPFDFDNILAGEVAAADKTLQDEMSRVHSETDAQEKIRAFVESVNDGKMICLISEGGATRSYERVGNELHTKKGVNVTGEAFKKYSNGWKIAPVESGTLAKKPVTSVGAKTERPEASAEFVTVLDEIQKEKINSLDVVQTPEDYVVFRKNKMSAPKSGSRYFFDITDIKKKLKKSLSNDEMNLKYIYEEKLERKARDKFLALKDADLKMQFDREQTKIDEAKDEPTLIELKKSWERKLNIALPWEEKAVFDNLSLKEQDIVKRDYLDCSALLHQILQHRLEGFRRPRLEIKDLFNDVVREKRRSAKELLGDSSDEALQGKYADYIRRLNQLGQGADAAFERNDIDELNRALRAVNEVKFVVGEEKKRDARPMVPEKRKEYSDEELFAILVEHLHSRKKPFPRDTEGRDLVIESVSDTEIKYHYGEKNGLKVTPKYVKKFLQFLKEKFSVIPKALQEKKVLFSEEKEVEGLMTELGVIISEKKALFGSESTKVSASPEVLGRNMTHLDRLTSDAQVASSAGDMRKLRTVLKWAKKAEFRLDLPMPDTKETTIPKGKMSADGTIPDVDPSKIVSPYGNLSTTTVEEPGVTLGAGEVESKNLKEGLYEELEISVTKAKKKQYESVVTEGMAPFVKYMEQNPALTLQTIINNNQYGGVEKVARAFAKELEAILPSTWSDADRKLFAFVFTKKQIEDLFE